MTPIVRRVRLSAGVLMLLRGLTWLVLMAASSLLRYLPLLLVPPAVGVMVYASAIAEDFWAIFGTLTLSLMISVVFVGWLPAFRHRDHPGGLSIGDGRL
ncbi:hypothetical protein AO354_46025 [Pseudomonas syringae pv. syringae]|nr:hypothetical protein AO354_46025 [Pseudomonas syringae pv. syringae]